MLPWELTASLFSSIHFHNTAAGGGYRGGYVKRTRIIRRLSDDIRWPMSNIEGNGVGTAKSQYQLPDRNLSAICWTHRWSPPPTDPNDPSLSPATAFK